MPGHWVLARIGKRVLRPGGMELTRRVLERLAIKPSDEVIGQAHIALTQFGSRLSCGQASTRLSAYGSNSVLGSWYEVQIQPDGGGSDDVRAGAAKLFELVGFESSFDTRG